MKSGKRPRPLLLFYVVVVYVLIQFGWWAWLLVSQNNQISKLQSEILYLQSRVEPAVLDTSGLILEQKKLQAALHKQWLMILGEGSVFLLLLVLGILRTRNSFRKEAALNAQQKNFILSVTHELRSPLASIRLQLETVQKRSLPKEKQDEIHSNAIEDIDRLNALVENILVAARIDNHSYIVHPEKNNLSSFVTELSERVKPLVLRSHLLETAISDSLQVKFDKNGFHSIFMNLVENAVKYSPASTTVSISLVKKNNEIIFSVADSGPGIPDAEKENIFARFYRIGNEETRSAKGTGLGLYIVKSLADAHGWEVSVVDQPGKKGSVFQIRIISHENK